MAPIEEYGGIFYLKNKQVVIIISIMAIINDGLDCITDYHVSHVVLIGLN